MKNNDAEEQERVLILAERVKNLLVFSALLVPDLDLLKKVEIKSIDVQSKTNAMAPIFGAVGMDYEEKEMEAGIRRRRAEAIVNLVKVIKKTEEDRTKFQASQMKKAEAREQLSSILGL